MQIEPKTDKTKTIGIVVLLNVACLFLLSFLLLFKELVYDNVSSLIYLFITSITAIALLWLLSRGKISGKNVLLAIPLTMAVLLVLLVLFCRWEGGTEGFFLASPAWLELVSNVFSYEALLGESVYVCTLFYWPGLIVWIASVSILRLISGKPKKTIRYL